MDRLATNHQPPTTNNGKLRVAIVCDWLTGTGGAERVVLELHHLYPDAPIFTSQYNSDPKLWYGDKWFSDADIRTTWLQKLPKSFKKFLPVLRAWTFGRLDLSDYDLVISSSGAEAKAVRTTPKEKLTERVIQKIRKDSSAEDWELKAGDSNVKQTLHISYCHSPTHYYWSRYEEYLAHPGFGRLDWLARIALKMLVGPMRRWDFKAAQRPDLIITNSAHTKKMIKKYYGRNSEVIHPPVDTERFKPKKDNPRHGFIAAGRQTPYKKIDLAVAACTKLNVPLLVIGNGPDHRKLRRMAGRNVTFLTNVSDMQIAEYMQTSKAYIFPGIDDFGILAVEALAAGTPVVAFKDGGALDYVVPEKTGLFFDDQTPQSLMKILDSFKSGHFNSSYIAEQATKYSSKNFRTNIKNYIGSLLAEAAETTESDK